MKRTYIMRMDIKGYKEVKAKFDDFKSLLVNLTWQHDNGRNIRKISVEIYEEED